jgi:protein-S-isoprenylcysteine O-methyltransferase Ste14
MVFDAGLMDAGVAIFILVALAQYARIRDKSEKGYNWLAAAGVILLFAGLFSVAPALGDLIGGSQGSIWNFLESAFEIIGWIFALVGVVFIGYETIVEK